MWNKKLSQMVALVAALLVGACADFSALNVHIAPSGPAFVATYLYYGNSLFDGGDSRKEAAIATDKEALLPGAKATFKNYSSYYHGINGVIVDFRELPRDASAAATLTAGDFEFLVGNSESLSAWIAPPAPSEFNVLEERDNISRVVISWEDDSIQNRWLRVKIKANANTGLSEDVVFYWGNAVGDSGNDPLAAVADANDHTPINEITYDASIENRYDYARVQSTAAWSWHIVDCMVSLRDSNPTADSCEGVLTMNNLDNLNLITAPAANATVDDYPDGA